MRSLIRRRPDTEREKQRLKELSLLLVLNQGLIDRRGALG
jgi:hypothetical protein